MAIKPVRRADYKEVTYNHAHWALLRGYREKAKTIMKALESHGMQTVVHGSIARGDVHRNSDVDVFIVAPPSSFLVETALETARIHISTRLLIQATPTYAVKAYIEIDPKTSVSFPLMRLREVESEFYKFGGEANLNQLKIDVRVAGVDKRLMLIEPTEKGHIESSVVGREEETAKILSISAETVRDRVRALLKRDIIGRTGVFIKKELVADESFEMALKKLADENPAVRRKMRKMDYGG
jgi:predicted nucleotidyltransferase